MTSVVIPWTRQAVRLTINRGNDVTFHFTVVDPHAAYAEVDLTGGSATFYRKASRREPDDLSYSGVLVDAAHGRVDISVPAADNDTPGVGWWRLDIEKGGDIRTASFGPLEVLAV